MHKYPEARSEAGSDGATAFVAVAVAGGRRGRHPHKYSAQRLSTPKQSFIGLEVYH